MRPRARGQQEAAPAASAGRYAYGTLSAEEKALYDIIYDAFVNWKEDVVLEKTAPDTLEKVFYAVLSDHGGLFWVSGYSYRGTESPLAKNIIFSPAFTMTKEERDEKQAAVDAAVSDWLTALPEGADDYAKSRFIYESLVQRVDYVAGAPENQNILSVFLYGQSVCQGYADAASYLFDQVGIPSVVIRGQANGQAHAWNLVSLDGDWYYFDATWGNSRFLDEADSVKSVNYAYLNATSEEMATTHTVENDFPVPECTAVADNYYHREGLYFALYDRQGIGNAFANAFYSGLGQCSIKFSNAENYASACDYFVHQGNIGLFCQGLKTIYYNERKDMLVLTVYFDRP